MTDAERKIWFQQWCEDLKHKTDAEIAYACTRYRQNAENKFFPSSGQLMALCQPAFESKPRRYADLEPLPPALPERDAMALIERTRQKYPMALVCNRTRGSAEMRAVAERAPLPYVESDPETLAEMRERSRLGTK